MEPRPGLPAFLEGYGPVTPWTNAPLALPPRRMARPATQPKTVPNLLTALERADLHDGAVLSFHHHLRNGDALMAHALQLCAKMGLRNLHIAPSSIFPCHAALVPLIQRGVITRITTSYMNGPVADAVRAGHLATPAVLQTHGGRAAAIEDGRLPIDLAIIAAPAVDDAGNITGAIGRSACGPLGYAMVDAAHARYVIAVTDASRTPLPRICIPALRIDQITQVDSLGDATQITSGTTAKPPNAQGQKIAEMTARVVFEAFRNDPAFSFQTGAGATSLATANALAPLMHAAQMKGDFASGGITAPLVDMHHAGLFTRLQDVQAFDLVSARSYATDPDHMGISASEYASPARTDAVSRQLACAVLGATEVDRAFNVNVTTTSDGRIIGGSGGHSDVAQDARLTIVTTPTRARGGPKAVPSVLHRTTPGSSVDLVVTEAGVTFASDKWDWLKPALRTAGVPMISATDVFADMTPRNPFPSQKKTVAVSEHRDGRVIDLIRAG
ncbi:citrate lyase subunit alpha [Marivita sp. S6314]|uniref:citrate lyase subunit alpha n=1 Tax=Marivita sp. S6314 TaxID=2926406 RepID=UPI001FF3C179|nr:citrate lyase subunit alpha [Marivita sp. S6314]MCK0149916.1 citrate lyase subunit alpha [Marivita sp. S6314]